MCIRDRNNTADTKEGMDRKNILCSNTKVVFQSSYLLFEHFVTFDIVLIRHIGQEVVILSFRSCFFAKVKFDTASGLVSGNIEKMKDYSGNTCSCALFTTV